jgi:hypothetical protein
MKVQLIDSTQQSLVKFNSKKLKNEIENKIITQIKDIKLENITNISSFYQLSNFHSFLISNLTIIILLFVLKPSILLSSTRLLSLSLFTY